MKNLFSTILLLLFSSIVLAQDYRVDTLITPISADMLRDTNVSSDVFSILNGKTDDSLYVYKCYERWDKRHTLHLSLVSDLVFTDFEFFLGFSEPLRKTKEKRVYQTTCSSSLPFMSGISHISRGKWEPYLTTRALNAINQEIVAVFSGQPIRCIVKAYKRKGNLKHYCHLHLESGSKKLEYIFIIKDTYFYQCVVRKNL